MDKKRTIFVIALVIMILLWLAFSLCIYCIEYGIAYNSDLGNYLSGVFAPISAFGTIIVTFLIYKLTSIEKRRDDDFRLIIGIFYKIQETYELLKKQNLSSNFLDSHDSYYERQIKVDCLLLLNYIRRYPNKMYCINNIEKVIWGIYVNPSYESDYIKLADEIQNFCFELNPDWKPMTIKIENNEKN